MLVKIIRVRGEWLEIKGICWMVTSSHPLGEKFRDHYDGKINRGRTEKV